MRAKSDQNNLSILIYPVLFLLLTGAVTSGNAATKNKNIIIDNPDRLVAIQFSVKFGKKKSKTLNAHCYGSNSGMLRTKRKEQVLISFTKLAGQSSKKAKRIKGKKAKQKHIKTSKMYKQAASISKALCEVPNEVDELEPFRGNFGELQAHTLFDRFAFGATQAEINRAVAEGLDATVTRLTTYNAPARFIERTKDLRCDGVINQLDPGGGEVCNAREINDVDFRGVRYDIYYRMLATPSPYFEKIFLFLHDRIAASADILSGCERHALPKHVDLLRRHAKDGDYKQLVLSMINDGLMLKWLDGALSVKGTPNENFPREFWELFTVGTTDLDGRANYTSKDIAESSRAFTGWAIEYFEVFDDYWACLPTYVPYLYDDGIKVIFRDTAHERVVRAPRDVFDATFAHPSSAEELAKRMLLEFATSTPKKATIRKLAQIIRNNNYNLHPAAKVLMRSNLLYSPETRKQLIKNPIEFLIGFLRATKIPVRFHTLDDQLKEMGMHVTRPDTVFGWNEVRLSDEAYVLPADNAVINILRDYSYQEANGFSFRNFLHNGITSRQTIAKLSGLLGIQLTEDQIVAIDQFMNYDLNYSGELERRAFDADEEAEYIWKHKTAGALALLAMAWEYRMK